MSIIIPINYSDETSVKRAEREKTYFENSKGSRRGASKMSKIFLEFEKCGSQSEVREWIRNCEGKHSQQVAYSTFHDCLIQVCYGCRKVRTNGGFL